MSERLKLEFRLQLSMRNKKSLDNKSLKKKQNILFISHIRILKHNSSTVLTGQEGTHSQGMLHQTQLLGSLTEEWDVSSMFF